MNIVEANQLTKRFNGFTAVDNVSFSVGQGEVFGFLGPNGAGKTTTISMICTLLKPTSGSALIAGVDVTKDPMAARRAIGLIFQDPSLDERLTAIENMRFHARIYSVPGREREDKISELLEMIGLSKWKNTLVKQFSGGMKRRLEIARGLIHSPGVLFLDEPTLGLDPQTRKKIWDYIHHLRISRKLTVFLTTHYMEEAENCDRIAVIDHGRVIAEGSPDQLKSQLSGDIVVLKLENPEEASPIIKDRYGLETTVENGFLRFEVQSGETFLPEFLKAFPMPVDSVSVHRPTLEDVFIKLTGRTIREEVADSVERMRTFKRAMSAR